MGAGAGQGKLRGQYRSGDSRDRTEGCRMCGRNIPHTRYSIHATSIPRDATMISPLCEERRGKVMQRLRLRQRYCTVDCRLCCVQLSRGEGSEGRELMMSYLPVIRADSSF